MSGLRDALLCVALQMLSINLPTYLPTSSPTQPCYSRSLSHACRAVHTDLQFERSPHLRSWITPSSSSISQGLLSINNSDPFANLLPHCLVIPRPPLRQQ